VGSRKASTSWEGPSWVVRVRGEEAEAEEGLLKLGRGQTRERTRCGEEGG
jgi:hypothetical protein